MFHFFHERPLLLGMVLFILSLLGIVGYLKMPRNMYPDVERPQVMVVTQLPGASALSVAQKVSRPIEQELYTLSHIRDVQSTNKNEVSIVRAEFEYEKGLDAALLDVNNALSRVRAALPPGVGSSSVYAVGGFTQSVMVLALVPKPGVSMDQVRLLAENDIRSALLVAPNIANVEVFGGFEPVLRVDFNPEKLAAYHISEAQLNDIVSGMNRDWPLGSAQGRGLNRTVTIYGERASVESLRALPIRNGLELSDIANVRLAHADRFSAYHGNGKPAIALSILRAPGGSVEKAIEDAQKVLPGLKARFPNIDFVVADTQGELIRTSNENMIGALRDAILFTSVVILFFLANWRAVATALVSIPLVFLGTLAILWLLGKELNVLVMTGIILSLGMLVDDAVVVLENIERHLEELHEDVHTAVMKGTEEVLFPVFVGTLATAVVIAPLMFAGDFPQQIFKHLILAVLISVFVSFFVAVTVIPRLSLFWYRNGLPERNRLELWMEARYQKFVAPGAKFYTGLLEFAFGGGVRRRLILVVPAFILLVVSFRMILPLIGKDALPPMDTGIVKVHIKFGDNVQVRDAEARLAGFEKRLMADPRVERVSAMFGSEPGTISIGSGQLPSEATYSINYVNRLERGETSNAIEADLRKEIASLPGVVSVDAYDSGATALSTIKAPVDIRLSAADWRLLPGAAEKVKVALQHVPGFSSVSTSWDNDMMEESLVLDEDRLRVLGLTPDAVYAQLPLKGSVVGALSKLPTVNAIPVRSYFDAAYSADPRALALLPIRLPSGQEVSLGEIGRFVSQPTVSLLTTDRLQSTLDIFAYRNTAPISILSSKALEAAGKSLPPGVDYADTGDNAQGADSSKRMLTGLAVGILLLFGVLAPAYRSVPLALLSILILPLSAIGAVWGLLAFNKALALPAILGIILLFSIIIKNSILIVDFIQGAREAGSSPMQAAVDSIKLRYRPILMTAFGTIAGMIPIAMERAVGLERLSPLADAAIGGLLVGTLLSLFYLPMFYVWLMRKSA